jgi:hypothetical protein
MDQVAYTNSGPQYGDVFKTGAVQIAVAALVAGFINSYATVFLEDLPLEGHPSYQGPYFSFWEVLGPSLIFAFVGCITFAVICWKLAKLEMRQNAPYLSLVMACFYGYGSYELWTHLPYRGSSLLGWLGFQSIISVGTAIHPVSLLVFYMLFLALAVIICKRRNIQAFPSASVSTVAVCVAGLFTIALCAWLMIYGTLWIFPSQ